MDLQLRMDIAGMSRTEEELYARQAAPLLKIVLSNPTSLFMKAAEFIVPAEARQLSIAQLLIMKSGMAARGFAAAFILSRVVQILPIVLSVTMPYTA